MLGRKAGNAVDRLGPLGRMLLRPIGQAALQLGRRIVRAAKKERQSFEPNFVPVQLIQNCSYRSSGR